MNLYILDRLDADDTGVTYDAYDGHVIRAESESDARRLASECRGDEGPDVWLDPSRSSCMVLAADGPPGVILSDFHAG